MMARRRGVQITTRGFADTARNIEAFARAGGDEMTSGLRVIGEEIMTDVRASRPGAGAPRDEGNLAASGRVTGPEKRSGEDVVTLSFGGAAAPYGLRQHEELQYRHTVGEARYLVRGVERWQKGGRPTAALQAMAKAALARVKK